MSLLLLPALLVQPACYDSESGRPPNVVIISVDTLRADHLGCYGYPRDTSPHIDRFAERSIRYSNALAPAPWTLPSHVALLSGRHPHEVGIRDHRSSIPDSVQMLAESLRSISFQTAAFVDSSPRGYVGGERGFARGFESYSHAPYDEGSIYRYDMAATVEAARHWLTRRDPERPFFLFLHTKSVHGTPSTPELLAESDAPYHSPTPYRERFLGGPPEFEWTSDSGEAGVQYLRTLNEQIAAGSFDRSAFADEKLEELVALYDGGIYYVDEQIGWLLTTLDRLSLADSTLIVITADHGEAFLEHDLFLHKEVFKALLHVPLLIHDPTSKETSGITIDTPVSLMDVAGTVLRRVGLAPPTHTAMLPPFGRSDGEDRPFFSAFEYEDDHMYHAAAIQQSHWKTVVYRLGERGDYVTELFDVLADPHERRPITDEPERKSAMLRQLQEWLRAPAEASAEAVGLDSETTELLEALGYL